MKIYLTSILLALAMWSNAQSPINNKSKTKMKVAVWDTYVTKQDGSVMHFDIIAPEEVKDTTIIYGYGKEYMKLKGQEGQPLTSEECRFCHVRTVYPEWESDIQRKGYYILEMENCK
ncbi:MAG TPA: DUF2024 family protein [Cytophagaceae bacterium]